MSPSVVPGMKRTCTHIPQIREFTPAQLACEECLKLGDRWVHLRMCRICGKVGCCDDSKNRHATSHFHDTGHAVMSSLEPEEDWMWCFVDQVLLMP